MTYDEFSDKLRTIVAEAVKEGRDVRTVDDLVAYLDSRIARPKKRGARSLKGLSLG